MMSFRLRRILAYSLAALLFVSTSGIPVHKMICLCKGDQEMSWSSASESACCQSAPVQSPPTCCDSKTLDCGSDSCHCQDHKPTLARIYVQFLAEKLIQTWGSTQDLYSSSGYTAYSPVSRLYVTHTLLPSTIRYLPASPPFYRTGCQIRC